MTLQLEYELKALSGNSNNGIPIISNEQMSQTIRLKEGETSMVSGLLDRETTKILTGIPGLAKIPGAGYLFGSHNDSLTDNQLLILITPRALRVPDRDTRSIYAGRGDTSGRSGAGGGEATAPPPAPRPEEPAPAAPGPPAEPPVQPTAPPTAPPETQQPPAAPPQNP